MAEKLGFYTTAEEALRGADLTGKQALVTGGNSGLGAETVRVLAGAGCNVLLASRSAEAGQRVADSIAAGLEAARAAGAPAPGRITVAPLSLDDLHSVAAFAAHPAVASLPAINFLVLNAGIMGLPTKELTKQGFEAQWGVCHVGHHRLATTLLPKVVAAHGRVVALTSFGHNFAQGLPLDDLNWEARKYSAWPAYGQAKLCNALFALELARRMREQGAPVQAFAVHPGFIDTPLSRHMSGGGPLRALWRGLAAVPRLAGALGSKTVPQGAATTVWACVAPELEGRSGAYLADCQVGAEVPGLWGRRCCAPSALATDGDLARALWDKTEELIAAALAAAPEGQQQ